MPLPPPPAPQKPPSEKKKPKPHKPSRDELERYFVNYWTNHGYANLKESWDDIERIAGVHNLNAVYLAAYLMSHGVPLNDVAHINARAAAETKRIGRTQGRDERTRQFINKTPVQKRYNLKNYDLNMKGSWREQVEAAVEKGGLKEDITNPVLKGKGGQPIKDRWGVPIRRFDLEKERLALDDMWQQYLGRHITKQEALRFTINPKSAWRIQHDYLTKLPGFFKGDVWKSEAPLRVADWEEVYGVDKTKKPPRELIRQAILRGSAGQAWFQDAIRKLPQYKTSVEYKRFYETYASEYNKIIGEVDEEGRKAIDASIMGRGSAEEFVANLRRSPRYAQGREQRSMVERDASAAGIYIPWHAYGPTPTGEEEPTTKPTPPTKPPKKPPKKRRPGGRVPYPEIPVNARGGI